MIRASSMSRVMTCGASHRLQQNYPNESGDAAQEGTLAHDWAAKVLTSVATINDVPDPEMRRYVDGYVKFCQALCGPYELYGIEEKAGDEHISGTCDFFNWSPYELTIVDLKYGYGWVWPEDNWQLITYACLVWLKHGNQGQITPPKVRLIIYQPRANKPGGSTHDWVFDGDLLRGYWNQICNRVAEIESGTETAVAGKHCRYCRAIVDCKTNREACSHVLDFAQKPEVQIQSNVELAYDLDITTEAVTLLKHRLTALEARAEASLKRGDLLPGWVLSQKTNPLSWMIKDPIQAGIDIGVDLAKPSEPITPTQAVNRKLLSKEMVAMMTERKPGKFVLKRQSLENIKRIMQNV